MLVVNIICATSCAFQFTMDLISVLPSEVCSASTLFGLLVNAFSRIFFPVEFRINSLGFVASMIPIPGFRFEYPTVILSAIEKLKFTNISFGQPPVVPSPSQLWTVVEQPTVVSQC